VKVVEEISIRRPRAQTPLSDMGGEEKSEGERGGAASGCCQIQATKRPINGMLSALLISVPLVMNLW
jgi:hypothetical protein